MKTSDKMLAALSYLGALCIIPKLFPDNELANYHSRIGLDLYILSSILLGLFGVLSFVPFVGIVFRIILILLCIFFGVIQIIGIVNVFSCKTVPLPILDKIPYVNKIMSWDIR